MKNGLTSLHCDTCNSIVCNAFDPLVVRRPGRTLPMVNSILTHREHAMAVVVHLPLF